MGRKSQRVGARFEKFVGEMNGRLKARGQADIRRVKPPMNILGFNKGKLQCVYSGEPSVDFQGTMLGGRAVYFDAKSVDLDRFRFSIVEDSQLGFLAVGAELGACSFLLVERRVRGRVGAVYVLPVSGSMLIAGVAHSRSMAILAPETRESVRFDALEGWKLAPGETWYDVVMRQEAAGEWARMMEVQWTDDTLEEVEEASTQLEERIVEEFGAKLASKWRKGAAS